ncbi:MAG: DUF192 domain-containing protein [Candidatus Omnitrophica bacterium]|nr:DUF192 domain-containing protein [Candidatus Omnitrophota bacterium]
MRIQNISRGTEIAFSAVEARGFLNRLTGLIGKKYLERGSGLILRSCSSVHTLWMRFPIDIIFADRELVVCKLIRDLKPWSFSPIILSAHLAIELPAGMIDASLTQLKDQITLTPSPF